jgi:tetratricopeptide (TPR) repeat protein
MLEATYWRSDLQAALGWADEILEMVGDDAEIGLQNVGYSILIWASGFRGTLKAQLGMLEEGRREVERAVQLGRDRGDWEPTAWALGELCWIDELTGQFDGTLGRAQQALEYAERVQSPYTQNVTYQTMGLAHLLLGEPQEALDLMERVHEFRRERRTGLGCGPADMAALAAANLAVGNTILARSLVEEALSFAERGGAWQSGARVYLVRAQTLRESEGPGARDEVEVTLAQADALIREKGARAWAPFVCEERARLAQCLKDPTAERHLREAHRLFVEMGATGHAQRLATELGI